MPVKQPKYHSNGLCVNAKIIITGELNKCCRRKASLGGACSPLWRLSYEHKLKKNKTKLYSASCSKDKVLFLLRGEIQNSIRDLTLSHSLWGLWYRLYRFSLLFSSLKEHNYKLRGLVSAFSLHPDFSMTRKLL